MWMTGHQDANCPECGGGLLYGTKEEATSYKVFYECSECTWEAMAGRVTLSEIDHQDEVDERARELGERWA